MHPVSNVFMRLLVSVKLLSGETEDSLMHGFASVGDLRTSMCGRLGVKSSRLMLVTDFDQLLHDDGNLLASVASWFVLADVLDLDTVEIHLTLSVVVTSRVCSSCESLCSQKCSVCMVTRYCSRACQCRDWQHHKKHCLPR